MSEISAIEQRAREAFKRLGEKAPDEIKVLSEYITSLKQQNTLAIGTDEAFVLRDGDDEINCIKRRVHLSLKEGTLVQPVPGGPSVVSAQGYEKLNDAAGVSCVLPPHVLVDGHYQQNPYVLRDEQNGRIKAIYCRALCFGFNSTGLPQVSDWTTIFDIPSYRLIDLLSKAKKFPQAFKLLPAGMEPEGQGNATWAKYFFDEATFLWVNTQHEEALQWFASIINREKKAIDYAQTFAKRNASKHFHGLQKAPAQEWDIAVYSWRSSNGNILRWDNRQYKNLQQKVEKLAEGDGSQFALDGQPDGVVIDLKKGSEDIAEEELVGEMEPEDAAEEQKAATASATELEPEQPAEMTEEEARIMAQLEEIRAEFFDEYLQAKQELGLEEKASLTPDDALQIYTKVNALLDV
jgi:hypothetical protein